VFCSFLTWFVLILIEQKAGKWFSVFKMILSVALRF